METQEIARPLQNIINLPADKLTPAEQVIVKKYHAWGRMGAGIHNTETMLNIRSQSNIQKLWVPETFSQVPDAEKLLTELKSDQKKDDDERKTITKPLSEVNARLMLPAKSYEEPIKSLEDAIIKLKQKERIRVENQNKKNDEKVRFISVIQRAITEFKATSDKKINDGVESAFIYALNEGEGRTDIYTLRLREIGTKGNVKPEDITTFIKNMEALLVEKSFDSEKSKPVLVSAAYQITEEYKDGEETKSRSVTKKYHSDDEISAIFIEYWKPEPSITFVSAFGKALNEKFFDYKTAYENKEAAITLAAEEKKAAEVIIDTAQKSADLSTKLQSASASQATMSFNVKELKKSYAIDMPETLDAAMAILSAFIANKEKCLPKLKVNKWFAFTPNQAGIALAKVKCDDNTFQPEGLSFKEIDKL